MKVVISCGTPEFLLARQNWLLAEELQKRGHEVTVISGGSRFDLIGEWKGCTVTTWPSYYPVHFRDFRFGMKLFKKLKPDIVMANWMSVNVAMPTARFSRVPIRISWYRHCWPDNDADIKRNFFTRNYIKYGKRFALSCATHLAPVSDVAKADAMKVFGVPEGKCRVFSSCRLDPMDSIKGEPPKKPDDHVRIICVGRLVDIKGQDILIRAAALMRKANPDLRFKMEFIGGGPRLQDYTTLIEELGVGDIVELVGHVDHEEVYSRLAGSHLFALPTRQDASPGVVGEALGMGVPVMIAEWDSNIRSWLGGSDAIRLMPPESPESFAEALTGFVSDPAIRERMTAPARELFRERFDLKVWLRNAADWFEELHQAKS
jgi:glycosyltransferase involved in cell wall biosynthesis